jgi:two-component system, NtrC family, sensor kinase
MYEVAMPRSDPDLKPHPPAHAELYEELRRADRVSLVARLASSMAHALGTPLNVVSGRAAMIASGDLSADEIRESAEIIAAQAASITELLRQTLDASRRRRPLTREPVAVAGCVTRAWQLVSPLAAAHDTRLVVDDRHGGLAPLDAGRVLQLLTILMSSLLEERRDEARGDRVLDVMITAEHIARPHDRRAAPGRYVRLSLSSDLEPRRDALEGGLDPFVAPAARFAQMDLGLFVCHGISREHGGWIEVERSPEHGRGFRVYLPEGGSP